MKKTLYDCPKCVGENTAIKYGKTNQDKQRYKCKKCSTTFLKSYSYKTYDPAINSDIKILLKEGVGIRSSARIIGISKNTVISRILKIAENIKKPFIPYGRTYEPDVLCTKSQKNNELGFDFFERFGKTTYKKHILRACLLKKLQLIWQKIGKKPQSLVTALSSNL